MDLELVHLKAAERAGYGMRKRRRLDRYGLRLREDILEAQAQYQPDKKPWGCRFEKEEKVHLENLHF